MIPFKLMTNQWLTCYRNGIYDIITKESYASFVGGIMGKISNILIYRLYETHKRRMLNLANSVLKDTSASEDVVQEAFIKLIKYLETKDEPMDDQHLQALTMIITRQVAYREYNKRKHRREVMLLDEADVADVTEVIELVVNKVYTTEVLKKLVDEMKPKHLEILMLKYAYQYSSKEIAKIYDIEENNVNQILLRTRSKAKKVLGAIYEF